MMKSQARGFILLAALGLTLAWAGSAKAGGILYASLTNGVIERYDLTTGQDLGTFASGLNNPQGMAFDSAGNLFVANGGDGTISRITSAGTVSTFATGFQVPTGLAFDAAGNLCVANFGGDVSRSTSTSISRIAPNGTVSTFASVNFNGYYGPNGLAFDASGNLYTSVSRFDNVLKVAPTELSASSFLALVLVNSTGLPDLPSTSPATSTPPTRSTIPRFARSLPMVRSPCSIKLRIMAGIISQDWRTIKRPATCSRRTSAAVRPLT